MRNACASDSRWGLACDASARDAKSPASDVGRAMLTTKTLTGFQLILTESGLKLSDPLYGRPHLPGTEFIRFMITFAPANHDRINSLRMFLRLA